MRPTRVALVLALAGVAVLAALPGLAAPDETDSATNKQLAEVRRATRQYQDLETAEADGYVLDDHCVPGMGYHALREPLNNPDGDLDHRNPEVLVYAPAEDGDLELAAVEYLSPDSTSLFGKQFDAPHGPVPSWTLHAWVWRGNPDGVFTAHNPKISCPE